MLKKQYEIFIAFFRSGILGFGGGPAAIPLVHKEVVETFGMMTDEEFTDVLSIGNTLPGPIATKMAGYIGYRVGGVLGLFNALLATVLPSAIALILFLTVLSEYKDLSFIQGMTHGVVPIVAVMMLVLTWDFLKKGHKALGGKVSGLLLAISALVLLVLGVYPAVMIGALLILALALPVKGAKS